MLQRNIDLIARAGSHRAVWAAFARSCHYPYRIAQ
jgi:hypothetical protein